jgi:hypothetical protein
MIRPCKACGQDLLWIKTAKNRKQTPVDPTEVVRTAGQKLAPGKYYDKNGHIYDAEAVPDQLPVFRSHWGDCPEYRRK